jgi:uncharacterized protein (TIGR03083 family)
MGIDEQRRARPGTEEPGEPRMARLDVRFAVHRERLRLAAMLDECAPEEWEQGSLVPDWRVREVVAHLVLEPQLTYGQVLAELVKARGDFHSVSHEMARRKAREPIAQLTAELRTAADSERRMPFATNRDPLAGILVHGQDIAIPLHRSLPMPPAEAAVAASGMWRSRLYSSRRSFRGLRLAATDVTWVRGNGDLVSGPIEAILMVLAGRTVALPRLSGPGVTLLASRLNQPPPL